VKISRYWLLLLAAGLPIVILAGCTPAPSSEQFQQAVFATLQAIPSEPALPTYTPYPTYTPQPTVVIYQLVTPTSSPTPLYTPTETLVPSPTLSPTSTLPPTATTDPLYTEKGPGIYLVNVDIAPGVWRSQGTGDNCYWAVKRANGDIIDNHFGMACGFVTFYRLLLAFSARISRLISALAIRCQAAQV